jgi:S1-C subfamily serine protease
MSKITGVVVTEVEPASFAEDVDFARGDVITEINHTPINNLADYKAEMAKLHPGSDVLFKVARHSDSDRVLTLFLAGAVPTILAQ